MSKKKEAVDACPFPPDGQPPSKTFTTNALDLMDRLLGWRTYFALVSVMGLVMAFSLLMVPPSLIPASVTPPTWNKTVEATYPQVENFDWIKIGKPDRNYTDQIVLDGSMVLEFKDEVVDFRDLVLVKDDAKIILRNSTLLVPHSPSYDPDNIFNTLVGIRFEGNASLWVYNSTIIHGEQYDYGFNIGFIGKSRCHLENTTVVKGIISFDESATLEASNSKIQTLYMDGSSSADIKGSEIKYLHQYKYWRDFESPLINVNSSILLTDSRLGTLWVNVVNATKCTLTDLRGEKEHWNIYDDFGVDGATMNLTLIRSEVVYPINVYAINSILNVSNAVLDQLITSSSTTSIVNSTTYSLGIYGNSCTNAKESNVYKLSTGPYYLWEHLFPDLRQISKNNQTVNFTDARIQNMEIGGNSRLNFKDVLVDNVSITTHKLSLEGSVRWGSSNSPSGSPYNELHVNQTFNVHTMGQEHVTPKVDLVLTDQNGEEVWRGVTDENGQATFNLTFCRYYPLSEPYQYATNYQDTWTLTGTHGEERKTSEIKFLRTNTPITLTFKEDTLTLPVDNKTLLYLSLAIIIIITLLKIWTFLT